MYFIFYSFFYLVSLLPWRVFYILSDGIAFLLQYVIRYRIDVVKNNLLIAFPEKTDAERKKIAKEFYSRFVDSFVETIKLISISDADFEKRYSSNYEVVNELYKTGQNVQVMTGHFFSWEFANWGFSKYVHYPFLVVYMPLSNQSFNRLILKLRSRYGSVLIPATNFKTQFHNYINRGPYALALAADQNPGRPLKSFWVPFFGRPTPFVKGPEKGAILNNTAQVFVHFYRTKRGYYHAHYEVMTTTPKAFKEGALTAMYVKLLEERIKLEPANYLWSHRRWKYAYEAEKHAHLLVE